MRQFNEDLIISCEGNRENGKKFQGMQFFYDKQGNCQGAFLLEWEKFYDDVSSRGFSCPRNLVEILDVPEMVEVLKKANKKQTLLSMATLHDKYADGLAVHKKDDPKADYMAYPFKLAGGVIVGYKLVSTPKLFMRSHTDVSVWEFEEVYEIKKVS